MKKNPSTFFTAVIAQAKWWKGVTCIKFVLLTHIFLGKAKITNIVDTKKHNNADCYYED